MSYGSRMSKGKGGEDQREHETTESGSRGGEKLVKDNGMEKQKIKSNISKSYHEGAVTRTTESFQKSKNNNEFGY